MPPTGVQEATEEHNVRLTKKTTLSKLYRHPLGTVLEYPETSHTESHPVVHLFEMDPQDWKVPDLNIAYSRGSPRGRTLIGREVFFKVMVDREGNEVLCTESYSTCQGVKICPYADVDTLSESHTVASLALIQSCLRRDREQRLEIASPSKDIFQRTAAYITALRKLGCSRPLVEPTPLSAEEAEEKETRELYWSQVKRGHRPKEGTCEGKLLFSYDSHHQPPYDLNYIEAVLNNDQEEVQQIEQAAFDLGYGLTVECSTVSNASSQRAICPHDHRDAKGNLLQPLMERLPCSVRFRVIEPLDEYRVDCPYILITSSGPHTHSIPFPSKTPPVIRAKVFELLEALGDDIPDITPRRFLRHPIVKSFLTAKFPHNPQPTLSHLHISLANRSKIKAYIKRIKEIHCPFGTTWKACEHYIRRMYVVNTDTMEHHEEDDDKQTSKDKILRILVCMSPIASHRLLACGSYLQSDIAFQRISDFLEFELACMDRDANTSLIFCRVFLNRQTAVAHQMVFTAIHEIVYQDTGKHLRWRHLHANSIEDFQGMILQWGADQHRGQAKGLGLYLQALAASMPPRNDLHDPARTIQSLNPYEHLHRVFRLCSNHFYRNINAAGVTDEPDWMAGDSHTNLVETVHRDANREGVQCTLLGGLQKSQAFDSMKMRTLELFETYGIQPTYLSGHIAENSFRNLQRKGRFLSRFIQS
ncbi:hypothetical protein B0H14DRAFT_3700171 [Mycena olivaceomarginata]|nr:hypothetical protein B0H14DRAFT_3700171 [Mycena olivaceomarginata]